jgi:fatty acid desaturase
MPAPHVAEKKISARALTRCAKRHNIISLNPNLYFLGRRETKRLSIFAVDGILGTREWTFEKAALHGSSHYDLPGVLRWFTANIGMHHVHHLASGILYYRLPWVLHDYPELRDVSRVTLLHSLRCVRLVLWDETRQRLISFREVSIERDLKQTSPRVL